MSLTGDWISTESDETSHQMNGLNVAALVTAAALETYAVTDYEFIPLLNLYYQKETGYFFKQGCLDFYHPSTQYCYHYNCITNASEWIYDPDWAERNNCLYNLNVYLLLRQMIDRLDDIEPGEILELEDGEILDDSDVNDEYVDEIETLKAQEGEIDPCIRLIASDTDLLCQLNIVTIQGAVIGSGDDCDIRIQHDFIDKKHCSIQYDSERKCYAVTLLTDRPNVSINDSLIIDKDESYTLNHRDQLNIENVITLNLHIHKGWNTCTECEPGLRCGLTTVRTTAYCSTIDNIDKEKLRKRQLKKMKAKYGLPTTSNVDAEVKIDKEKYVDRADIRRKTIGSDLVKNWDDRPIETVSVLRPISNENRGFKMLSKMGWKQGQSLGGDKNTGIKEPIMQTIQMGTAGLGSGDPDAKIIAGAFNERDLAKRQKVTKMKERFYKSTLMTSFSEEDSVP